jgi:energy-coupling factor transporter ATP-binding protein EcfA2
MATLSNSKSPFPGLRPFEKDEYHLFFGREEHVQAILDKLFNQKFVCVVGNSGSGKSSLVRAGVLPKLRSDDSVKWHICTMRPGADPVRSLFESIFFDSSFTKDKSDLVPEIEVLQKNTKGLIQAVRPFLADGSKLLILADQFEELFRFMAEEEEADIDRATHFVNLLLEASAEKSIDIHVMMTIRSDFLGDCERFYGLPEAINNAQFLVPRLNRKELQRIIEAPVKYAGAKISPRLVQILLNSIGTKTDLLPLLQHLLNRLWNTWEVQTNGNREIPIDIEHYDLIGGIDAAMSNHLEEVLSEFDTDQSLIIENLFKTITVKGSDNRGVRRPTKLSTLCEILRVDLATLSPIIEAFRLSQRGFIMPPPKVKLSMDTVIDISHESLMRVWPRLIKWVDQERDSLGLYYRLCESTILFEKGESGLWRDPDLAIGLSWLKEPRHTRDWSLLYNDQFSKARQFLVASEQNANFELAEKKRKKRLLQAVLIGSSLIMACLTIFSFVQKNSADKAAILARESTLKAEEQAEIARAEKQHALEEESFAQIQRKKAEEQKQLADKERLNAINQKRLALNQKAIANAQRLIALNAKKKAENSQKETQTALEFANKAKKAREEALKKAIVSEKQAQKSKNYVLSKSIALKSKLLNSKSQSDLKIALATEALKVFKKSGQSMFDRDLHAALLDAKKSKASDGYATKVTHSMECRSVLTKSKYIVSVGLDGRINVVSGFNNKKISSLVIQGAALYKVVGLDKENKLVILANKKDIYTVDLNENTGILDQSSITKIAQSQTGITDIFTNGSNIVFATKENIVEVNIVGNETNRIHVDEGIDAFTISNDDSSVGYVSTIGGKILQISWLDKEQVVIKNYGKTGRVNSMLNKNGHLYLGFGNGRCKQISLSSNMEEYDFTGHTAGITDLDVSGDGRYLATSSFDGVIRVYSLEHKAKSPLEVTHHKSWVYAVRFSPKDDIIYSAGRDRKLKQFKVRLSDLEKDIADYEVEPLTDLQKARYISE